MVGHLEREELVRRSVEVREYDPEWPRLYEREKSEILQVIGDRILAIEHIGSTAVPGLGAKPTVDIMIGVRNLDDAKDCIEQLNKIGYEYVPEYEADIPERGITGMPDRRYFRKGPRGARTYHIHMVETNSQFWMDHLLFRDYVRAHPETAREYYEVKKDLTKTYPVDRVAYQHGKSAFIQLVMLRARSTI